MHTKNICHRDLKLDNILTVDSKDESNIMIKVCDFGFAQFFDPEELMTHECGTPPYMAPEIFIG